MQTLQHSTVEHTDGLAADCVETQEYCVLLMGLNLVAWRWIWGKKGRGKERKGEHQEPQLAINLCHLPSSH